jgi:hypothetical protein
MTVAPEVSRELAVAVVVVRKALEHGLEILQGAYFIEMIRGKVPALRIVSW